MNKQCGRRAVAIAAVLVAIALPLHAGHYSWTTTGPEPGMIFQIVAYAQNPNRLYLVGSYFGGYLFRTDDRGQNWCYVETLPALPFVVADETNPDVLYAPSYPTVVKTTNGGVSWQPAAAGLPPGSVPSIAIAPSAPATLYAISGQAPYGLYRSHDGAASWSLAPGKNFSRNEQLQPDGRRLRSRHSPTCSTRASAFWKSPDGGATWDLAGSGLPPDAQRAFSDPNRMPGTVWAAGMNDAGVLQERRRWCRLSCSSNSGIADRQVRDMSSSTAPTR